MSDGAKVRSMTRVLGVGFVLALGIGFGLAGCSGGSERPDASLCAGTPATVQLIEGYCKSGEADRCYYDHAPMDGF